MDKKYHIFSRIAAAVLIAVLAAGIVIQMPVVQTRLATKVLDKVNAQLANAGADIKVGFVNIQPDGTIIIRDASLLDRNPYCDTTNEYGFEAQDTIMHFESIYATFSLKNLFYNNALFLKKAIVDGATINVVCEPYEGVKQWPNINRAFGLSPEKIKPQRESDVFEISKVTVKDIHVSLRNYVKDKPTKEDNCIDWNDFACVASVDAEHISFRKGIMRGRLMDAKVKVKGGYELLHVKGRARVGNGITLVENAKLQDKWSDIDLPLFILSYKNAKSFRDFNNKVHMNIRPGRSLVSSKTLQYFTHLNSESNVLFDLRSGHFNGYVNSAYLDNFHIVERLSGLPLKVNGSILGLGRPGNFAIDMGVNIPSFTTESLEKFIKGFSPEAKAELSKFAKGKDISLNAFAHGRMNSVNIGLNLGGELGALGAKFNLANINDDNDVSIKGNFNLNGIDLGSLLDKKALGKVDATASLKSAFTEEGPTITLDSLKIDRLSFKGYDYSDIIAKGKMTNEYFDGSITSHDPNADLDFNGVINYGFKGDMRHSIYLADIRNFDLSKTNIFSKWETAKVSAVLSADYFATSRTDAVGTYTLDSLVLDNGINRSAFNKMDFETYEENSIYHFLMNSEIATVAISSNLTVPDAIKGFFNATVLREIPDILPKLKNPEAATGNMSMDFKILNVSKILAFFYPELSIGNGTSLQLNTDMEGAANLLFTSRGIKFKGKEFKGLDLTLDNLYGSLNSILTAKEVKIGNLQLKNNVFSAFIDNNNLNANLNFSGNEADDVSGELFIKGSARKMADGTGVFTIRPLPSYVAMRGSKWQINKSEIEIRKGELQISDLIISNGNQSIKADGGISRSKSDTLDLVLNELDLSSSDELTEKNLSIKGIANGKASIYSSENAGKIILGRISCKGLNILDSDFGDISLSSVWNNVSQRLDIGLLNKNTGINSISANGSYSPENKAITANISLGNLSMSLLSSLFPNIITESGGSVSGNISIDGQDGKLGIYSEGMVLNDFKLKPAATNVPYIVNGLVKLRKNSIDLADLSIKDHDGGHGTISGTIYHKSFRDLNLKLNANLHDMRLIDIPENSEKFYGKVAANVQASLTGPLAELNIFADVATSSPGEIHVPLASTITQKQSDLLTFRQPDRNRDSAADDTAATVILPPKKSDIGIRCRISATEDLKAYIEIDKENENIIEAAGEGTIIAELRPSKKTANLTGDYNITNGQYHFTALGSLIHKDFTINPGSSINFGGAIKDTKIDVSTTYTLKASLATLIADSTSVAARREVNCGINIGNDIKSPSLSFSINIPDLDPTTKSKVEGALNTEDKVQRQFVSLLLTNSFYPAEQSGVSYNDSNILYSNISSIMSGQVNSILKKLDIPIDLGLSYLKNEVGTNIFDVAVSTQLFHNRVQINGSVGNRQRSTATRNDVVGNIDIGIKLDKEGKLQIKLFSHSSDDYTKFLDNGQKNGLGISFQKEFKNKKSTADSTRTIIIE